MTRHLLFLPLLAAVLIAAGEAQRTPESGGSVEHGRYIVERVAMCIQCHTPRSESGDLLLSELLMGAPMPVRSPYSRLPFAFSAPRIAGLPGYTDEQGIRLLTEGITRRGVPPQPPMPPFRMTAQDARDVVAFLKSLNPRP